MTEGTITTVRILRNTSDNPEGKLADAKAIFGARLVRSKDSGSLPDATDHDEDDPAQ